jgi:hypothetical protein
VRVFLGKKRGLRRSRRGQAAVEFLTTYGWAILGVLVILGALSYFDLLDAKRFVSERCDIGSQLQCTEIYANDEGAFMIALRNNYPVDIEIEQIIVDGTPFLQGAVGLSAGNVSAFPGNVGEMIRGSKQTFDILVTFRRDSTTPTRSYNVTGTAISKVHDASEVPLPNFGVCGDGILTYPEVCDTTDTRTCASMGYLGSGIVQCINCNWDVSVCEGAAECGNGVIEPGEQCDGGTTTCAERGLQGGSTVVECVNCIWNTSVCTGGTGGLTSCTTTTECQPGEFCVEEGAGAVCRANCESYNGRLCTDQPTEAYINYGVCTVLDPSGDPASVCDTDTAADYNGILYDTCKMLADGVSCDNDSLAGGFVPEGICQADFCVGKGGLPDGSSCTAGEECSSSLCIDGVCQSTCKNHLMGLCSNNSNSYNAYGVCVQRMDETDFICDDYEAAFYLGVLYGSCSGIPESEACDNDSLAGGYSANAVCQGGACVYIPSGGGIGDPCSAGTDCAGGLCVFDADSGSAVCAADCWNDRKYTGALCSSTIKPYDDYGICTNTSDSASSCDEMIAAPFGGTYWSDCSDAFGSVKCDPDSLAGGYGEGGTCVAGNTCQ